MGSARNSLLSAMLGCACLSPAQAGDTPFSKLTPVQQRSEDILRELVAFESTSDRPGQIRAALQSVAVRLLEAGFDQQDVRVLSPHGDSQGLIARYRGMGSKKPVMVIAHVDVVPAIANDWAFSPFTLGLQDGYYVGRGTADNKAGITQIVSNFIRLKQEGWVPERDVIAAISGDEETSGDFANWLANEGRSLADPEFVVNADAGGGELDESGQPLAFWLQTSEKLYQTYLLTSSNPGGHSSQPRPDNAIRDLAEAIIRLSNHEFPVILNNDTRLALERAAALYPDEVGADMRALARDPDNSEAAQRLSAKDPALNAWLRTTCVPTMLNGGHAENALPRAAGVTVNCRILPGTRASEVEKVIAGLVNGLDIDIEIVWDGVPSDASSLPGGLLEQVEALVEEPWGEIPVIPAMSTGATDGLFFRNAGIPVFGMSALFSKPGHSGAHGLNEKIGVREFHDSVEFWYRLLVTLAD